ncbi:uncharacterized protein BT62DRAFT_1010332 [Guyanagaster necrorhizus]|uniref:Uncharacterized protein n=1 Tax=Guyanagaster necrorhizus TaxID=856835 RepID=A0A9P7VM34_9AGAR|nr:uncharacterized protein BT62DRAFT_1010332 [Guyanagaster necrorhizus MCA 3950]KAG7442409.1 hypothetical protein BT62DRAFT_1010332 [Guyanagaster necrorhizus MCA 3950]
MGYKDQPIGTRAPSTIPAVASDKRDGEAEISMKEDDAINVAAERRCDLHISQPQI